MQKTLPRTQNAPGAPPPSPAAAALSKSVAENAVVVLGLRGCCMVHVARSLLRGQGVNPVVHEIAGDAQAAEAAVAVAREIAGDGGGEGGPHLDVQLPAVFIGGCLVGGLDRLMAVHISGDLVPILRDAGALWL